LRAWLKELHDNEFDTAQLLMGLDARGWDSLALPLGAKTGMQRALALQRAACSSDAEDESAVGAAASAAQLSPPPPAPAPREVSQVDCVVIDVSSSMRARSHIDCEKTREDVSKVLFHTLIDKLICLELSHAVGLVAFGERIVRFPVTKDYERFHDELGRLDANEGSTKLYDSILNAADFIEEHVQAEGLRGSSDSEQPLRKRIFVLTDGEDNSSRHGAWEVAQVLQERNIQLDAIPLANGNATLQRMCVATGGLCFDVVSMEQSMDLFERESTLHLPFREVPATKCPAVTSSRVFEAIATADAPVVEMRSAAPKQLHAPVLSAAAVQQKAAEASSVPSTPGSVKRIMKELLDVTKNPVEGCKVFMSADNPFSWKAIVTDLPGVFTGGAWLLTVDFPPNYPLGAPKFKFFTPIYHCNVSVDGKICLDTLMSNWGPHVTVRKVLADIRELLNNPDPDSPLDSFKATVYRDYVVNGDPAFLTLAAEHTKAHASESVASLVATYNLE